MQLKEDCHICDEAFHNVSNHIRMSKGDGHGPQGSYPDESDTEQIESEEGESKIEDSVIFDAPDPVPVTDPAPVEVDGPEILNAPCGGNIDVTELSDGQTLKCPHCGDSLTYEA